MLCLVLGLPAFAPMPGVGRSRWAKPAKVRMGILSSEVPSGAPVPLTGQTLQAALKMRCDTTGAQYAIYWSAQGGKLQATGVYASTPAAAQYTKESQEVFLDAGGQGPIAQVQRSGQSNFISDVRFSNLKRKELALKYGISQISMQPFEAGVIEFGNSRTSQPWAEMPDAPVLPKAPIRTAFEDLGALYVMFWRADFASNQLKVAGSFENPRDAKRRLALRGDGVSLGSGLRVPAHPHPYPYPHPHPRHDPHPRPKPNPNRTPTPAQASRLCRCRATSPSTSTATAPCRSRCARARR